MNIKLLRKSFMLRVTVDVNAGHPEKRTSKSEYEKNERNFLEKI